MKYKTLYYYVVGAIIIGFLIGIIYMLISSFFPQQPSSTSLPQVDLSLAPHSEQPNATLPPSSPTAIAPKKLTLVPGCSLHFSFAPQNTSVSPGGTIYYTATLLNLGTDPCLATSFSIYYSRIEHVVNTTPRATAANYYWSVGTLASAKSFTATITTTDVSPGAGSQIQNEGCATGDNSPDVCADNVIFVENGAHATAPLAIPRSGVWGKAFQNKEFGTWIWNTPLQMTPASGNAALSAAAQNGFTSVYVTIDDYLDIVSLPEGPDKEARRQAYFKTLSLFISSAHAKGIAVDVEGGARDWAESANRWKGDALVDFVREYNQAYPSLKVRGLQYDVEPYLLPEYEGDKASVLEDYLAFVDEVTTRMQNVDARLSVVIPHFYDSTQQWTPSVSYNGKTSYTLTHLLTILQKKPGSTLIVMAYRNFSDGADGAIALARAEVEEAASGGYATKIVIAQETGAVQPPYVTFHGLSKAELYAGITALHAAFGSYASFGGIAIHYLDPFLELK